MLKLKSLLYLPAIALLGFSISSCESEIEVKEIDIPPTVAINNPSNDGELDVIGDVMADVHDDFELATATIVVTKEGESTPVAEVTENYSGVKDATIVLPGLGSDGKTIYEKDQKYIATSTVVDKNGSTASSSVTYTAVVQPKMRLFGGGLVKDLKAHDNQWYELVQIDEAVTGVTLAYFTEAGDQVNYGSTLDFDKGVYWVEARLNDDSTAIITMDGRDWVNKMIETVGMIGPAASGDWGTDIDMTRDADDMALYTITLDVTTPGECKARANDDWYVAWGDPTWPSGTAQYQPGAPNFNVPETGTYKVELNIVSGKYTFTKE